jgi:hypothetical protein
VSITPGFCATQFQYIQTSFVKSSTAAITATTDTPTIAPLLFLRSVHFLFTYFSFQLTSGDGVVFPLTLVPHLHLVLKKYFPVVFILATCVLLISFLYAMVLIYIQPFTAYEFFSPLFCFRAFYQSVLSILFPQIWGETFFLRSPPDAS